MANVEYSFLSSSQFDGTEYGTSELESVVRKRADEITETRVSVIGVINDLPVPTSETQPGLGKGCTKYCPSDCARTFLKKSFAENPPPHIDPISRSLD